jgi:hypothetical protein
MSLNSNPGDPAADSYIALADANTYFANRNITAWSGTDTAKEGALRVATSALDNLYRTRWIGIRSYQDQSLGWPRIDGARGPMLFNPGFLINLYDIDGFQIPFDSVPLQVQHATCEAAVLVLQGVPLEPRLIRGGMIKSQANKVDVIEQTTVWQDGAPAQDRFIIIEGLLRSLVKSTPGAPSGNNQVLRM